MHPTFESVTPRLPVSDVAAAATFYTSSLGFKLGWQWGEPVSHANVCRDQIAFDLIHLPARAGTAILYVGLTGIDAYYAELLARGVVVGDLADRPYGMRDFEIVDPWGNRLAFGEPSELSASTR